MKYFSQILVLLIGISLIVLLFFVFSLRNRQNIVFTDGEAKESPSVTIVDPHRGPSDAKVTIVNFGDYACGPCAELESSLQGVASRYGDRINIVWKDFPNADLHPEAMTAAIAAHCAGKQGKFWEYHDGLFAQKNRFTTETYTGLADALGLKRGPFDRCLEGEETRPLVERNVLEGSALRLTATPTIWVNDERRTGILSMSELARLIDTALAKSLTP